jgi:hypothetical protein
MKHNEIKFPVGSTALIKSDYRDKHPHRATVGTVVNHSTNPALDGMDPFIDNMIRFEDGTEEPFANWEIEETAK